MPRALRFCLVPFLVAYTVLSAAAADCVVLTPQTWEEYAVTGKEADCIYGDIVLRNEHLAAVIAAPVPGRNANMTVRNVGGSIIDLTERAAPNDQLGVWYAFPAYSVPRNPDKTVVTADGKHVTEKLTKVTRAKRITWECAAELPAPVADAAAGGSPAPKFVCSVRYTLEDGWPYLLVETTFRNFSGEPQPLALQDNFRADKTFEFGLVPEQNLFWAHDDWFRASYGVVAEGYGLTREGKGNPPLKYDVLAKEKGPVEPGKSVTLKRKLMVAGNLPSLRATAAKAIDPKAKLVKVNLTVRDPQGDVNHAQVLITTADNKVLGSGRTKADGTLNFECVPGVYSVAVTALGRSPLITTETWESNSNAKVLTMPDAPGYVVAKITDDRGGPIPCKVQFINPDVKPLPKSAAGKAPAKADENGPAHPYFGPDSAAPNCRNVVYTAKGEFRQEIGPGKYHVIISHGPEYDAVFTDITVERGRETSLTGKLVRTVDTAGWVSADFHSHSTPSGDNTTDTLGRVLNLVCEHLEFAPCTEHNRITTYNVYLKQLGIEPFMKSCAGMELTGMPLPLNHQNAFPLLEKPRTQDGGGPTSDVDPEVQIERLALWDEKSDKLVQCNHPNLVQMLGDRDQDGKADRGFARMFGFMDVVEIHDQDGRIKLPLPDPAGKPTQENSLHWARLLNLGYRIPGVVNTDAHYNFHGSGWLRNWVKSSTDDPQSIDVMEMVHAAEKGNVVVSNGPFLTVEFKPADSQGKPSIPGENSSAPAGQGTLHVRVQCPNWFDVNRVQVMVNGRLDPALNFTRRTTPEKFSAGVVKFDQQIPITLKSDAHLIVAALGEEQGLGPVMGPDHERDMPAAISNPIFVDTNGNGFEPNCDALDAKPLVLPENVPADKPKAKPDK